MMSEKRFKIDTTSEIGHIYINNQEGEHMSWIEVENTLNEQQARIEFLEDNCLAYALTIKHLNGIIEEYEKQFKLINDKIDEYIKTADTYRIPISSLKYGDELGYFNGVYQYMKKLKETINNECELDDE